MVFEEFLGHTLHFGESVGTNQHVISLADHFSLYDTDASVRLYDSITQTIVFTQTGKYTLSGSRAITQTLVFKQSAARSQVEQLYQNLTFTQTAEPGNKWRYCNQLLAFGETLHYIRATGLSDALTFQQSAILRFQRTQHVTDILTFNSYAVIYRDSYQYITGPVPSIMPARFVTFKVGTNTLTLRPPEFGNRDEILLRRIQRETLGGDLIIYRDPAWSTSEAFDLDFTYIDDIAAQATQDFVRGTLGQLVIFTDHEGNSWTGLFNNPDFTITTAGRFNNTFSLRFEVIFA